MVRSQPAHDDQQGALMAIDTATATSASTLDHATAMVDGLREQAVATERSRRVSEATFDDLADAGILGMCAPAKYGGAQLDFKSQIDVLAELARGCPSTSWVATILSALAWMAATYPDQAQEEVFGDGDHRVSGVLAPVGTLTAAPGGYTLNGKWGFNTGGDGSKWTVLGAMSGPMPHAVIVRSSELDRQDDWFASGMAGTGSSSVIADDVFVPDHRVQALPAMINGEYPDDRHNAGDPYFNLPLATVLSVNAAGTPVGTARGAFDVFMHRLPGRAITYTTWEDQRAAPITHLTVGEAALLIDSSAAHAAMAASVLDAPAGGVPSMMERVQGRAHVMYSTRLAREAVDLLFHASGATCIQPDVPIQRYQRDIQALANHAIMHGPTGVELYGRVLCGLEPNTLLV
jgi:alkylation response protein AidB-like acyl-CoA dehydrogenase